MREADDRLQRALELSFAYLNRREHTVGELRRHLERKGIAPAPADACIQRLIEDGYLDDSRFALMFAADKRALEGWGGDRIRRELAAKGLDHDLIDAART